jgi:curli biogenesis system outer membrane secretion channel CsgG
MKKVVIAIVALLCIGGICGGFYYASQHSSSSDEVELTKVQKIITRDLDKDYPATPREVVKFYNRIITSYFGETYSDEEFDALAEQAQCLFDTELLSNNPLEDYKEEVKSEIQEYNQNSRQIRQASVCDSGDVQYVTDKNNGDQLAYVTSNYFVKEGNSYERTYQMYVLRKDDQEQWKILTYYKVDGTSSEDDSDD